MKSLSLASKYVLKFNNRTLEKAVKYVQRPQSDVNVVVLILFSRKTGEAYGMGQKVHILVNLGQIENKIP